MKRIPLERPDLFLKWCTAFVTHISWRGSKRQLKKANLGPIRRQIVRIRPGFPGTSAYAYTNGEGKKNCETTQQLLTCSATLCVWGNETHVKVGAQEQGAGGLQRHRGGGESGEKQRHWLQRRQTSASCRTQQSYLFHLRLSPLLWLTTVLAVAIGPRACV